MMTRDGAPVNGATERDTFQLIRRDTTTAARLGSLRTRRGEVPTPAFMPVGTQASVKALTPEEVATTGTRIVLANTYHLMLRPGPEILREAGGLHAFMRWDGPILTDSGGFQIFSLAHRREVGEEGVVFRSHLDGSKRQLSPESVIDLQLAFGSDVTMPLDELVGWDSSHAAQADAMRRTHRWLRRALDHFVTATDGSDNPPLLFGIAQGGFDRDRRGESAAYVASLPVDGCAVGGLSVGEPKEVMAEMLAASVAALPAEKPRYLMGVGSPEDLWHGVAAGIDLFDCVHPTRVARRGALFSDSGRVNINNARFRRQFEPFDPSCDCLTCRGYSAAYLHHLFRTRELLAYRLATIHNLRFIQRQMATIRAALAAGNFTEAMDTFLDGYRAADLEAAAAQRRARGARRVSDG